ncbi:hypothetical protein GW943_02170 [Candidatus Parcubacteria bacterium]|uniref:Uncharacterized protein n=1 Tax=Candidatus Kaiserbacteria bacterium CG10_big_fil_rev_8_21_14_0_10_47_16 TaxID=1974608 RepID=A0A2H0UDQ0_9BACT|nr:hypothetical protein [Candidatus Parcubacteria bacterium]PIR84554.1 MAG: hypothetical protein COU16_03185 [Candidatus Kaiserbacteria bacterium CG10_big_fil_rev_8_21_14_0_10_47_16]
MSVFEFEDGVPLRNRERRPGYDYPIKRKPKDQIKKLGLERGQSIRMPDGIRRKIREITDDGRVFVFGLRHHINVYSIVREE